MRSQSFLEHTNLGYTPLLLFIVVTFFLALSFGRAARANHTYENDLTLLKRHINPIILSSGGQRLVVSSELQGRILIASADGFKDQSIGWINRDYLSAKQGKLSAGQGKIENIGGGADRLWFGPDGGKFSVFFDPGVNTTTENIRVPPSLAQNAFEVKNHSETEVILESAFSFSNHLGFKFDVKVARSISLFDKARTRRELNVNIPNGLAWVAYGSDSSVTNLGEHEWSAETGLFSIWSLSTFAPSAVVAIPLKNPLKKVTNYFVPPSDRQTRVTNETVFYNADAEFMNKIGIPPESTLPFIGSYDTQRKRLTIIKFRIADLGAGYTNAVWDWDADPLKGEIVNIFNDGIQENGKPFGPFYEMETSSAALALKPGQSHSHYHYTFHFTGPEDQLSAISEGILGVSIQEMREAF